jgi:hypothetical protein
LTGNNADNSWSCNDVACCRVIQTGQNHYWIYCFNRVTNTLIVNKDI